MQISRDGIVGEMAFHSPSLHFVDGEQSQDGSGTDWRAALQELIAVQIDRLTIYNGTLNFHNFASEPPVNLALTELEGSFVNLTNVDRRDKFSVINPQTV